MHSIMNTVTFHFFRNHLHLRTRAEWRTLRGSTGPSRSRCELNCKVWVRMPQPSTNVFFLLAKILVFTLIQFASPIPAKAQKAPTDVWIKAELRSRFLRPKFHAIRISVKDRIVTLNGTVRSNEDYLAAERIARRSPAVAEVKNLLIVKAPARSKSVPINHVDEPQPFFLKIFYWLGLCVIVFVTIKAGIIFFLRHKESSEESEFRKEYVSGKTARIFYNIERFAKALKKRRERKKHSAKS